MSYQDIFNRYSGLSSKYPLLSVSDETALCARYHEHRRQSDLDLLVSHNIRLVLSFVKSFIHEEEFISEGMVGLVQAAKRFDPAKGCRFSTYATYYIKGYIWIAALNTNMVRICTTPAHKKIFFNISKVRARLSARGVEVTPESIAEELQVSEADITNMEHRMSREVRLDTPLGEEQDGSSMDLLTCEAMTPDQAFEQHEEQAVVGRAMREFRNHLCGAEQKIFDAHLSHDYEESIPTLREIGDQSGYSHEYVRLMVLRIQPKLKRFLDSRS